MVSGIINMIVIPRGLGPVDYGNYSFLRTVFYQIALFSGFKTEEGLINRTSKYRNNNQIISWYLQFSIVILGFLSIFIASAYFLGISDTLFPNQKILLIFLAAFNSYLNYKVFTALVRYADNKGLTAVIQKNVIGYYILLVSTIIILRLLNKLSIQNIFISQIILIIILAIQILRIFKNKYLIKSLSYHLKPINKKKLKYYNNYFKNYSAPLLTLSIFILVFNYFDRWFLQVVSGPIDQGYLNIGLRFSEVILLFTSAFVPLFFKEIAKCHKDKNINQIGILYYKYSKLFFFISVYLGGFLIYNSKFIISLMLGDKYSNAAIVVGIVLLYPMHQTLGQINGAVLLATERTSIAKNIGIFSMILGLPLTALLVSDPTSTLNIGFGMGASGIAIKMVMIQFLNVSLQIFTNTKYLKVNPFSFILHQITTITIISIMLFTSNFIVYLIFDSISIKTVIIHGFVYSILTFFIIYYYPHIFGYNRNERNQIFKFRISEL